MCAFVDSCEKEVARERERERDVAIEEIVHL